MKTKKTTEPSTISNEMVENQAEQINTGVPEFTEEQKEYARMNVRKQFNETFSKWATIADEPATDEDIEKTKSEYEAAIEETKSKTYVLATAEGNCALRTAKILYKWNKDMCYWKNGEWRGVIAFDKYISDIIKDLGEHPEKDLVVDYATICFLYNNMAVPMGFGLVSATLMSELEYFDTETNQVKEHEYPVTYSGILEKVQTEVNMLSSIDKKLLILRERVNLAYAGLRMDLKITELEEFIEFANAMNEHTVSNEMEQK